MIISLLIASIVFWLLFIAVANLYHNSYKNATGLKRYAMILLAGIGLVVDVLYNFTYATVAFMQWPSLSRPTLTARMKYNLANDTGWRYKLSSFVCRKMVEPWDWNHCGLSK